MNEPIYKCPLCSEAMTVYPIGHRSVWVRCDNPCDPDCHEDVEGHGTSPKEAYEVACQKYNRGDRPVEKLKPVKMEDEKNETPVATNKTKKKGDKVPEVRKVEVKKPVVEVKKPEAARTVEVAKEVKATPKKKTTTVIEVVTVSKGKVDFKVPPEGWKGTQKELAAFLGLTNYKEAYTPLQKWLAAGILKIVGEKDSLRGKKAKIFGRVK